jgi:hypothetical protein
MECSVPGCIRGAFAKGLCHPHYDQDRAARLGPCKIDGCEKPQHSHGLCGAHYRAEKLKSAPPCAIEGCGRGAVANGLCNSHNQRKRRRGHLDPTRPADWGAKVKHPLYHTWAWQRRFGLAREWRDFWTFVRDVGDRPTPRHQLRRTASDQPFGPDNFEWREPIQVIETSTPKERRAAYMREYMARNPRVRRGAVFKRRYGIDRAAYEEMFKQQNGLCLICRKPETSLNQHTHEPRLLSVDHCHSTGKVRGLLCKRCNTGIGAFEEDPDLMKAAIRYIRRHKKPPQGG